MAGVSDLLSQLSACQKLRFSKLLPLHWMKQMHHVRSFNELNNATPVLFHGWRLRLRGSKILFDVIILYTSISHQLSWTPPMALKQQNALKMNNLSAGGYDAPCVEAFASLWEAIIRRRIGVEYALRPLFSYGAWNRTASIPGTYRLPWRRCKLYPSMTPLMQSGKSCAEFHAVVYRADFKDFNWDPATGTVCENNPLGWKPL